MFFEFKKIIPTGLAACLFVFVLGARWAVFDRFGMDLPEWDQWDAEGLNLLAPWFTHDHFWRALFAPHNEHRVVLTKLLNLGLTLANGQWDQRLEATVNAVLPATIALVFFLLGWRHLSAKTRAPLWVFLAVAFGLPLGWQNVLGGFHSQQFFLVGLAFAAIALLPRNPSFSAPWWLGVLAAALGLFSMASGFFAAVAVIAVLGLQLLRRVSTLRAAMPTIFVCGILAALGWFTRHEVDYHASLKAQSLSDFALTILYSLQWPAPFTPWFGLVMWLPWSWLTFRVLRSSSRLSVPACTFGYLVIGLGAWVWLQLLATGYARGAGGPHPASRYIDTLVFGLTANALALAWLASFAFTVQRARVVYAVLTVAWVGLFSWGVGRELKETLTVALPPVKVYHDYAKQNVRNYLLTGDEAHLNHDEIPYPGAGAFLVRIGLADLRTRLPVSVRPPLPLTPAQSNFMSSPGLSGATAPGLSPEVHALDYRKTWGTFSSNRTGLQTREFFSAPLRAPLGGWLQFEIAGHVGEPDVVLELRDAHTGAALAPIVSNQVQGNAWRASYVRAPAGDFFVYARAPDPARWLAFSEPAEMATGSFWAWQFSKHGVLVAEIALGAAALLALAGWRMRAPQS